MSKPVKSRCDPSHLAKARKYCLAHGIDINEYIKVMYTLIARKAAFPSFYEKSPNPKDFNRLSIQIDNDIYDAANIVITEHQATHSSLIRSTVYYISENQEFPIDILKANRSCQF